jgi:hypothetical protein
MTTSQGLRDDLASYFEAPARGKTATAKGAGLEATKCKAREK